MALPPLYKYLDVQGAKLTLGNGTFKHAKPSDFKDIEDLTVQSIFPEETEAALKKIENGFIDVILRHLNDKLTCSSPRREKVALIDNTLARETRHVAHELLAEINDYFYREKKHINEIIFVPMIIMSRIFRTHDAIELLLKNSHPSEAAVLALTQFELRLDLAYTASDVKHAARWLDHEDRKWSLMSVKDKIKKLFSEDAERAKLYYIFQFLSGIKHANPVYSELGFPARVPLAPPCSRAGTDYTMR